MATLEEVQRWLTDHPYVPYLCNADLGVGVCGGIVTYEENGYIVFHHDTGAPPFYSEGRLMLPENIDLDRDPGRLKDNLNSLAEYAHRGLLTMLIKERRAAQEVASDAPTVPPVSGAFAPCPVVATQAPPRWQAPASARLQRACPLPLGHEGRHQFGTLG